MPATRSNSKQPVHHHHKTRSNATGQHASTIEIDTTVLSTSSSEREGPRTHKSKKKDTGQKQKPLIVVGEVIEISSDDESTAPPSENIITRTLRQQIRELKEENAKYQREQAQIKLKYTKLHEENDELKDSSQQLVKGKIILDASQVDDNISCEICTTRIWSPHILPDCGHTFCQSCLQDWFGTTLAQFMTAHPYYNINSAVPYANMMAHPQISNHPHSMVLLAPYQQQNAPQPHYTCPTCRAPVKNRPVEDFALKALVRNIASAAGETSPGKKPVENSRGNGRAPTVRIDPWDGFFGRRH